MGSLWKKLGKLGKREKKHGEDSEGQLEVTEYFIKTTITAITKLSRCVHSFRSCLFLLVIPEELVMLDK